MIVQSELEGVDIMFYVMKKPYGIYEPEIVSKHKTKENAERNRKEAEKKHESFLSAGGFKTDGTQFL